jgi:spore coat protein CotF
MVDRWMEGTKTLDDGTDIGSRRKLKAYMREKGVTHMDDFSPQYLKKIRDDRDRANSKNIREGLERAFYKFQKP